MAKPLEIPKSGKIFRQNKAEWGSIAAQCQYDCKLLANFFAITSRHLARKFSEEMGISPQGWLDTERVIAAQHLLAEARTVKEVGLALGFRYPANFHRHFKKHFGLSPTEYVQLRAHNNSGMGIEPERRKP